MDGQGGRRKGFQDHRRYSQRVFGEGFRAWACPPQKTLVYSATIDHGDELREEFVRAGFNAESFSYQMSQKVCDDKLGKILGWSPTDTHKLRKGRKGI